jgi:hypothetical protein
MRERFVQRDRRELDRQAPREHDAALNRFDELGHGAMARVEAAERVGDADDRALERFIGVAHRLDERAAQEERELLVAIGGEIAAHAALFVCHDCRSEGKGSPRR